MPLPATHTISYNGYVFNSSARTRLTGRPLYDRSGRVVVAVVYTINVTWLVYELSPGAGCATPMAAARFYLNQPGKALVYNDNGFGNLSVNTNDENEETDLVWGPKPGEVEAVPIGNKACWQLSWSCDFCISECATINLNSIDTLPVMGFSFNVNYAIDERGLTTRTYNGYVQVPTTRNKLETADDRREDIQIPVPIGFKRLSQQYQLDDAKTTLTFAVVDQEIMAEALPWGCISASGSHSVQNNGPHNLTNWTGRISAKYTVLPTKSRSYAWEAFWKLCADRINQTSEYLKSQNPNAASGSDANTNRTPLEPFLTSFKIDEGLYENNREMSFEVSYIFTANFKDIVKATALWRPVPQTSAQEWNEIATDVYECRGIAKLRFNPVEDVLVDLCGVGPSKEPTQTNELSTSGEEADMEYGSSGYIVYQNEIEELDSSGFVGVNLLTDDDRRFWSGIKSKRDIRNYQAPVPPSYNGFEPPDPTIVATQALQARTTANKRIRMKGYAVRAWQPIPSPTLEEYGGNPVVPTGEQSFKQRRIGETLGTPIYHAEWTLDYLVFSPEQDADSILLGTMDAFQGGFDPASMTNFAAPEFSLPGDPP